MGPKSSDGLAVVTDVILRRTPTGTAAPGQQQHLVGIHRSSSGADQVPCAAARTAVPRWLSHRLLRHGRCHHVATSSVRAVTTSATAAMIANTLADSFPHLM